MVKTANVQNVVKMALPANVIKKWMIWLALLQLITKKNLAKKISVKRLLIKKKLILAVEAVELILPKKVMVIVHPETVMMIIASKVDIKNQE